MNRPEDQPDGFPPEQRTEPLDGPFPVRPAANDSFPGEYDTGPLQTGPCMPRPVSPDGCVVPADLREHPRYRIVERIGGGGMGTVFKAEHRFMGRVVALKILNRHLVDRPSMVDRFHHEVRAAASLSHPNIVQAFDADQAGDTHFLVMEYVAGMDLERLVAEQGSLSAPLAAEYARQVALGMQHAFECGMVHHDIKPQNLMLTPAGQVKILDFGLARYLSEHLLAAEFGEVDFVVASEGEAFPPEIEEALDRERTALALGGLAGTPDYMAPEEILNPRGVDVRADIYGLGCTLYRLLSGRVPFPGGDINDKLRAHLRKRPRPLENVPAGLGAVVARMMAKDPADRYQVPADVALAMTPFARLRRGLILVVEDDPDGRMLMRVALEAAGYDVALAAHGLEALERLRAGLRPDLVLLDLVMPVMDGMQFLQEQRRDPALASVPVVIVSAINRSQAQAAALGAAEYLNKPVDLDRLAAIIGRQGLQRGPAGAPVPEKPADDANS